MFDRIKQGAGTLKALNKLRQIQKQLSQERITVEEDGVKVVISGDMKIRELQTNGQNDETVAKVINHGFEKTQKIVAQKMQDMGAGLGNMLGGM